MDCFRYDKDRNLVSVINAVLKHFTGECFHPPLKELDDLLQKKPYRKIVILLFDGMGKSIEEKHLKETDFLMRKKAFEITSVFPPTTAAATTAICSCKYPVETAWLGWRQYFKNQNVVVDMFTNNNSLNGDHISGPHLADLYCSYEPIWDILKKKGIPSGYLQPKSIDPHGASSLNEFFEIADVLMKKDESHYYYMYWADPDHSIHQYGTDARQIRDIVKEINRGVARLAKDNKDNLIIVLADHSLINTKFYNIYEHKDFGDTLERIVSLDSRSSFFHVKSGLNSKFEELFSKYYGNDFLLLKKDDVINQKWFGEGEEHPLYRDFIGDYMATSVGEYGFCYEENMDMIGAHSGSVKEESIINVAVLNR